MIWNDLLSVFLQKVLEITVPVLAALVAGWLIGLGKKAWAQAKNALGDNFWVIEDICKVAVQAAEQVNLQGELVDKKEYAMTVAENWLAQYNIKLDLGTLDAAIEAAVLAEFNRNKLEAGVG